MTDDTLSFASADQILLLFGAQDRYLRQVREAVGVGVTIRGDQLRLHGTDEQIRRGREVFSELKAILEARGVLQESEVRSVLGLSKTAGVASTAPPNVRKPAESIDLLEKARKVLPRSAGQAEYVRAIREHDLVFCEGPAGSGKTYLAVAMAVNALRQEQVRKIVLVRPAVEAGEKLGFLPGDLLAKINPYLRPLLDALSEMLDYDAVQRYIDRDVVEIVPLAFMRGRTLNETFIILDEGQNTTVTQMKMFLTRIGIGAKAVITGDPTQVDLPRGQKSGLAEATTILRDVRGIGVTHFLKEDVVRHPLVARIVAAYEAHQPQNS